MDMNGLVSSKITDTSSLFPEFSEEIGQDTILGNDKNPGSPQFEIEEFKAQDNQIFNFKKNERFEKWNVGARYRLNRVLGQGSYGEVAEALDTKYIYYN